MSPRNRLIASLATAASALLAPSIALASVQTTAPGPGILGLVAVGIVVAIGIARSRK